MIVKYEDDDTKKTYGWIEGLFKLWGLSISDEIVMSIYEDSVLMFTYNGWEVVYYDVNLSSMTQTKEVFLRWMEDYPQDCFIDEAVSRVKEEFNLC